MVVNYNIRCQEPGLTIMDLTGQLTLGNALQGVEHAIKDLIEQGSGRVGVGFCPTPLYGQCGCGRAGRLRGSHGKSGREDDIADAHGRVKEVLLLTNLHRIIGIYPDLAAACAALAGPPTPPATA